MSFIKVFKRRLYKFGKNEFFENILPLKSEKYFNNFIKSQKQCFYLGIDPTAPSLQVGNLFPLIALLKIWRQGHDVIGLVGGSTSLIGDPTDRNNDRENVERSINIKNSENVTSDLINIRENSQKYYPLQTENSSNFLILNNLEWYSKVNVIDFVENVLVNFRFNELKNKRSFKNRLGSTQSVNMKEFFYPFLQAYDWLHLYRNYNCKVQLGGDDQMGNIHLGQILIDSLHKDPVYGLTVPLFTINGVKLGKSQTSKIQYWLNPKIQSPYSLYYALTHIPSGVIAKQNILERLTLLDTAYIQQIIELHNSDPSSLILQTTLADNIIKLCHGESALNSVKITKQLFKANSTNEMFRVLSESQNNLDDDWWENVPHIFVSSNQKDLSINYLIDQIQRANTDEDNENADALVIDKQVKFNGELITDYNSVDICNNESRLQGVLELGTKQKYVIIKA